MSTDTVRERYSRQMLFRPIGPTGQERLAQARVAIVGMGALGTILSTQVVRAGVGFVRLIDRDIIEPSNLQRQALYDEIDAEEGLPKAVAAKEKLQRANSGVEIEALATDLTWRNAESLLTDVDVILDGTDNFQTRYLINDVAVKHGIAWSYGGAVSSYGTTAFLRPGITPCLVCLLGPEQGGGTDTCDTVGVIAPIVSIIASLQVAETLKYLTGNVESLANGLTYVDVWSNEFRRIGFPGRNEACPCCGQHQYRALQKQQDALTVSLCGRQTIQVRPDSGRTVSFDGMAHRLRQVGQVRYTEHLLRFEVEDVVMTLFRDGRALIQGTEDPSRARSLYARYIGM
jgi:molybdopterin/thiamine biosynthesis adenylyltransferase